MVAKSNRQMIVPAATEVLTWLRISLKAKEFSLL